MICQVSALFINKMFISFKESKANCGGNLNDTKGIISSPLYSNPYPNNTECEWDITVEEGNVVSLEFFDSSSR